MIEDIKKRLSEEIKKSGISQTKIAKEIGITQSAIAQYVMQITAPNLETLAKLCSYLDLDANYILCITNYAGEK